MQDQRLGTAEVRHYLAGKPWHPWTFPVPPPAWLVPGPPMSQPWGGYWDPEYQWLQVRHVGLTDAALDLGTMIAIAAAVAAGVAVACGGRQSKQGRVYGSMSCQDMLSDPLNKLLNFISLAGCDWLRGSRQNSCKSMDKNKTVTAPARRFLSAPPALSIARYVPERVTGTIGALIWSILVWSFAGRSYSPSSSIDSAQNFLVAGVVLQFHIATAGAVTVILFRFIGWVLAVGGDAIGLRIWRGQRLRTRTGTRTREGLGSGGGSGSGSGFGLLLPVASPRLGDPLAPAFGASSSGTTNCEWVDSPGSSVSVGPATPGAGAGAGTGTGTGTFTFHQDIGRARRRIEATSVPPSNADDSTSDASELPTSDVPIIRVGCGAGQGKGKGKGERTGTSPAMARATETIFAGAGNVGSISALFWDGVFGGVLGYCTAVLLSALCFAPTAAFGPWPTVSTGELPQ